jgi:type I restriction-modification system DNA methylase subunit
MSVHNGQSFNNRLQRYDMQMSDVLKSVPMDTFFNFNQIHLCLALIFHDHKLSFSLESIFNHFSKIKIVSPASNSDEISEIRSISEDLKIREIYSQILKSKACSIVDKMTNIEIDFFKDHSSNVDQNLYLLEFFTKPRERGGHLQLSSPGLNQFIDQLVLNKCFEGSVLFPYLQDAFLPIKHALLNPMAQVTAYEINRSQYAFAKLLMIFYKIQSLKLINKSWLHSSLGETSKPEVYDIIINIPPMGLRVQKPVPDPENYPPEFKKLAKTFEVYEQHKTLSHLKEDGEGYLLTSRSFAFFTQNIFKFVRNKLLKDQNIETIFKLPGGLLSSTTIESILFHLSKKTNSEVKFVDAKECFQRSGRSEFEFSQAGSKDIFYHMRSGEPLAHRIKNINTVGLLNGDFDIDPNRFVDNSEAAQTRRRLLANYSDYEEVSLGSASVCKSIKRFSSVKDFDPETSVILPKVPTKKLKSTSQISDIRPDNYVIELNTKKLTPGYLLHFLKSELGQLTLDLAARSAYIPTLSLKDVKELKIPLPRLEVQQNIENAVNKLEAVNSELTSITDDLSSSPTNVETLTSKLDDILSALTKLSEPEKAFNIILQGEGELVEFKETFSLDVRRFKNDQGYKPIKEDKIEHSSLKTIAAFMNAKGGNLFIGVSDDAVILGVNEEIDQFHKGSLDKYLLHLNNKIQDRFETPVISMLSVKPIEISGKIVIKIKASPSKNPIFLKPNSDFYVRSTPATEKLTGNGMMIYIKDRFSLI